MENKKSFWKVFANFFKQKKYSSSNEEIRKQQPLNEFDVYFMKLLKDGNCEDAIKLVDEGYIPHYSFLDDIENHFIHLSLKRGGVKNSELLNKEMTIFGEKSNLDGLSSDNNFVRLCHKIDFTKDFLGKYLNGLGKYIKSEYYLERRFQTGNWTLEYGTANLQKKFTAGNPKKASLLTGVLSDLRLENIAVNNQLFGKSSHNGIYMSSIAKDLELLKLLMSPLFYGIIVQKAENSSLSFEEAYKNTIEKIKEFDITKISDDGFMGAERKENIIKSLNREKEQMFSESMAGILFKPYVEMEKLFTSGVETPESLFMKVLSVSEKYSDLSDLMVMIIFFHPKEVEHLITMENVKKIDNTEMLIVNMILEQREKIIQNQETQNMLEKFKDNKNTQVFTSPLDIKNKNALEKIVRDANFNFLIEPITNIENVLLDLANKKLDVETKNFLDNVRMSIYEMIKTFQDITQIDSSASPKEALLKPIKEIEVKVIEIQKDVLTQQLAALNGTSISAKVRVR